MTQVAKACASVCARVLLPPSLGVCCAACLTSAQPCAHWAALVKGGRPGLLPPCISEPPEGKTKEGHWKQVRMSPCPGGGRGVGVRGEKPSLPAHAVLRSPGARARAVQDHQPPTIAVCVPGSLHSHTREMRPARNPGGPAWISCGCSPSRGGCPCKTPGTEIWLILPVAYACLKD